MAPASPNKHQSSWLTKLGLQSPFDSSLRLVTSPILSPTGLAIFRLTVAVYIFVSILFSLIWDGVVDFDVNSFFSYFTNLSFIGVCSYFWASGVQSYFFARSVRAKLSTGPTYPLQQWPRPMQFLHLLLYSTVMTFPYLVVIVFWGLLASPSVFATTESSWSNITFHALTAVFVLSEFILGRVPLYWLYTPFLVILLGCYLGVAYITHATQGFYAYSFLDPQKQGAKLAAYIVGIPVGTLIIFALFWALSLARAKLLPHPKGVPELQDGSGVEPKHVRLEEEDVSERSAPVMREQGHDVPGSTAAAGDA